MPLLMYYTPSTPIEEMDDVKISYNDILQITEECFQTGKRK